LKKLIGAIVLIFIIITIISCIAISKKTNSNTNKLEKNIVIYTTESNSKMKFIAEEFKRTTGIVVQYKIVNNLDKSLEKAKNSGENVDIVYGGNKSEFINMTNKKLLAKTSMPFRKEFNTEYINKEGYWYGTSLEPLVMFYNTEFMVAKDAPTTFYQLGMPQYYNRIILPNYKNFTMESFLGAMEYQYHKSQVSIEYNTFLQGLKNNVVSYSDTQEEIFKTMKTNKETTISIGELDQVNKAIEEGAKFKVINPIDGSPMIMQGVGAVAGSKNINAAKLFIEFIAGANMQLQLADKFNSIPTLKTALIYAPKWMQNISGLNIANIDWNWVTANVNSITKFDSLIKSAKVEKIELQMPIIKNPLIAEQRAAGDKAQENKKEEENKKASKVKKKQVVEKDAEIKAKVSAMQKSALQGLQSFGETNSQ
jgi:iron(III) transport system substrate-binding protein